MDTNIKAEVTSAVEDAKMHSTRDVTKEIYGREKRKKNAMMYNVKESPSDDAIMRKEHDSNLLEKIRKELGADKTTRVVKSVRIGLCPTVSAKVRPLKVKLDNVESKQKLLGMSKNLSQTNDYKMHLSMQLSEITLQG